MRIAPEIRPIVTLRTAALLAGVTLLTCHGFRPKAALRESKPGYPISKPEDVARVPVVIEGLVIKSGVPVSTVQRSPIDGGFTQLWKGRVRVENVLQGRVNEGIVDIFYFIGDIPGSSRRILLRSGERNLFFLRWDGPHLRTTNDRSANACLLKVLTGPHPNFTRAPGGSINDAIIRLLLTRGNGVGNQQMIGAIEDPKYWRFVPEPKVVSTLWRVMRVETPIVREAACAQLVRLGHSCAGEAEALTVRVANLTRAGRTGSFKPGDLLKTTVTGPAHQPVYRSGIGPLGMTDANGRFVRTERVRLPEGENRTDVWMVGAEEMSPAITYVAVKHGDIREIITTPIGNPRDRYGMGLSAISVSGQTVITYSAMLLDYRTSVYYDAKEQVTLYEDGRSIRTSEISGTASAHQLWETNVQSWKDYTLQGTHHAVAAFQNGTFVNGMKFSRGSCYGSASNCQIVPLDGPANVSPASIRLGTTVADQSAVPQDIGWALKTLDPKVKASILDAALTRGQETTDQGMIAAIDAVAVESEFGQDLLVKKLEAVAGRETQLVRAEACAVLRTMRHPCSKRSRPALAIKPVQPPDDNKRADVSALQRNRLYAAVPKYLVFTHFLLMANEMKQEKLIAAFRLGWMNFGQRESVKSEASALTRELAFLDAKARRATASFRRAGALSLEQRTSLPPVPAEICLLQAMRTAAMVNHAVSLQAKLGPKSATEFEGLLAYQFAP